MSTSAASARWGRRINTYPTERRDCLMTARKRIARMVKMWKQR